jgi:8-oxo-dGTP pyrophosphatase MutT (NUDIX family)
VVGDTPDTPKSKLTVPASVFTRELTVSLAIIRESEEEIGTSRRRLFFANTLENTLEKSEVLEAEPLTETLHANNEPVTTRAR